jgi:hypothetical protein
MSAFGVPPPVTQSVSGSDAAERLAAREGGRKVRGTAKAVKPLDEGDSVEVTSPDALDPARRLARSGDEEAAHDRRRSGTGGPGQQPKPDEPKLDIQG